MMEPPAPSSGPTKLPTSSLAMASVVVGALSLMIPLFGLLLAPIAIILSLAALMRIGVGRSVGQGIALLGGGLGVFGILLFIYIFYWSS